MSLLALGHMTYMMYFVFDKVFLKTYLNNDERFEKYGPIFCGLKKEN